jgi:hypothetical protein
MPAARRIESPEVPWTDQFPILQGTLTERTSAVRTSVVEGEDRVFSSNQRDPAAFEDVAADTSLGDLLAGGYFAECGHRNLALHSISDEEIE